MTIDEQIEQASKDIAATQESIAAIEEGSGVGGDPEKAMAGLHRRLEQQISEKDKLVAKRAYLEASGS